MRLELREVIIGRRSSLGLFTLEDNDSSSFISDGKIVASGIEGKSIDDVLVHDFLVGSFVAKELIEFVVSGFG